MSLFAIIATLFADMDPRVGALLHKKKCGYKTPITLSFLRPFLSFLRPFLSFLRPFLSFPRRRESIKPRQNLLFDMFKAIICVITESIMPYNARKSWIPAFAGMTKKGTKKKNFINFSSYATKPLRGDDKNGKRRSKKLVFLGSTQQCPSGMTKRGTKPLCGDDREGCEDDKGKSINDRRRRNKIWCISKFIIITIAMLSPNIAMAKPAIVAALSAQEVVLDYDFRGKNITVSGILDKSYDIVITVKGPERSYRLWKKEREYGIWMKSKSFTIPYGTSYYHLAASAAIETIASIDDINKYNFDYLNEKYYVAEKYLPAESLAFKKEFLQYRQRLKLYPTSILPIIHINSNVFRTEFVIPEYAHIGKYKVIIYAFKNKKLVDKLELPFVAKKRGLYAKIDDLAEHKPLQYSLISIIIALSAGAIAAFVFRKDRQ